MLHLWNSFIAKTKPSPPGTVGLGFCGSSIVAVRAVREGEGYSITHMAEEKLPFIPFANSLPSEENCEMLSHAMRRLAESIPQTFWPLQIALPDPSAIVQVMEFDSLPESSHERAAIAQFRLDKEFPALAQMQCTTQVLSKEGEKGLLLATFVQRSWLGCLNDACRTAGYVPSVIDISISYIFNRFHDLFMTASGDGVLILLEQDSWSILIWDDEHRPRFIKSRWLDKNSGKDEEYEGIVQDAERLIMSYVLRVHGRRIGGIYICANKDDRVTLAAQFDKRLKIPCVQLDAIEKFTVTNGLSIQSVFPGLLAALVPRI